MSDTLYDPFSAAANGLPSQKPGMLGVSPSTWESIAQLGAGAIQGANQRTGSGHLANGTGLAGGIMGAVQGYYGDVQNQAKLRSALAQQSAQTQGMNIGNEAAASGLGLTKARNALGQQIMSDPKFRQQLQGMMNGGGADYGAGDYGAAPPPGGVVGSGGVAGGPLAQNGGGIAPIAQAVHRNESGGSMAPGIWGDGGQAAGPMQVHQAALDDVNRANGTNYTLPQLSENPQIGKWVGDQYLQQQVSRFGPRAGTAAYNAGPGSVQNAIRAGQPLPAQGYLAKAGLADSGQLGPVDPQSALAQSQRFMQQANQLEVYKSLGLPIPGDPAVLRQQAQKYLDLATAGPKAGAEASAKAGVEMQTAGPIAGAQAAAKFPYTMERVSPGGVLAVGGKPAFSVPQRSEEVITEGPYAGTRGQVYRDPLTGEQTSTAGGGQNGLPAGFVPTELSPQQHGNLAGVPKVMQNFIEHDNKMVDEDLAHVIENVTPAKQSLFQLRALNPDANTGAAGELRANFKNWVQTFAPDFVSQITGDASPAQEFKKIALMGAGKQERGDLGARGGFRAIEMYANANPNLENQPTANHDMANALLVSHQYHEDYAQGATDYFNNQIAQMQKNNSLEGYKKVSNYDKEFISKMRPELYANAISAMNGKPSSVWAKGLSPKQVQIVGGVLQRVDPSAIIDMNGQQIPVNSFKTTIGPADLMSGVNGGR